MEIHVVDAAGKHQVDVWLALRERGAEMFCKPGEGLAAGQTFAIDMGSRRGILQHRHIAVVLSGESRILAQSLNAEL